MPEHVILDGGLDLISARPAAQPGRLQDCLNYEVGLRRGYARIDGLERFDGWSSPSISNDTYIMVIPGAEIGGGFALSEEVVWALGVESGTVGVLYWQAYDGVADEFRYYIAPQAGSSTPLDGATLSGSFGGGPLIWNTATMSIITPQSDVASMDEYLTLLGTLTDTMRGNVTAVPGVSTIAGLHWHEDTLYAVRDTLTLTLDSVDAAAELNVGFLVYSPTGQVAEVISYDEDAETVQIYPLDNSGFVVAVSDAINMPLYIRFSSGTGAFEEGDTLTGGTSSYAADLLWQDTRDGSWDAGNAEGFMALRNTGTDGKFTVGETISLGGNTAVVDAVFQQSYNAAGADVATVSAIAEDSDTATMWRSSDSDGWLLAQYTRRMQFAEGAFNPLDVTSLDTDYGLQTPNTSAVTTTSRINWTGSIASIETVGTSGPVFTAVASTIGTYDVLRVSETITVRNFKQGISKNDEIIGIEVQVKLRGITTGASTGGRVRVSHYANVGPGEEAWITKTDTGWETFVLGGVGAFWGNENLTPEEVNDSQFRFFVRAESLEGGIEVDSVQVRVHVRQQFGQKLWLWDGSSDVGFIKVKSVQLQEGAWADSDAAGGFTLTDWSDPTPDAGLEIRTDTGGLGQLVAKVGSAIRFPLLPGTSLLKQYAAKYQFISYNFYASESGNAVYGCSGVGPAFVFDGESLDFIHTGVEADRPRHVAAHQNRLALGYDWGEVYISSATSPLEFDALTLASSHGFGDKITGLIPLTGLALGVFTESTISVIFGAALDSEGTGVEQRVINPKSGAIEYTVQDLGNLPIFTDFRGVSILQSTDQYGDFAANRLSHDATPWLVSRLQQRASLVSSDKSVVNSLVVRNKNQYRLFFADGYVFTLTLFGPELTPMPTIQRYWLDDDEEKYCKVFATASGVTSTGRDRIFMSVEDRLDVDMSVEAGYVYELDQGNSFDGNPIRSYLELTHYFSNEPMVAKDYNVAHIHGYAQGVAALFVSRAINYEEVDDTTPRGYEPCTLGDGANPVEITSKPKYGKFRLNARGFAVTLRIDHETENEFPHLLQMVSFVNDSRRATNR